MRQIVLDTETTGLEVAEGHRIIEIGCLEIQDRRVTENRFHRYVNPEREIDAGALEVHGIDSARLRSERRFAEIADEFLKFVDGAELIIHNAAFDTAFLDMELRLAGVTGDIASRCRILDTLELARRMHPGQKNSLDALCKRYNVDNSGREYHGALLDAQLLAEVYLAMTGGQAALVLDAGSGLQNANSQAHGRLKRDGLTLVVRRATPEEQEAHKQRLEEIRKASKGKCLWPDA